MTHLLVIREHLLKFYQNNTRILNPLFRFIGALIIFFSVNRFVGYNPALKPWYVVVILSVIGAVLPTSIMIFMVAIYTIVHIYYASGILGMALAVIFSIIYFIYIRFVPNEGFIIISGPILYLLQIPYALPVFLGLVGTPLSIIPMGCGIFIYYYMETMTKVIATATTDSIVLYNQVIQQLLTTKEMYLTIGIFAIVTIVMYEIRRFEFDYAFETALVSGAILNVILFLIMNIPFEIYLSIGNLLIGTVISAILAWCMHFFKRALNYATVEYLQFEDDEYYYYVKAVPKISIATPKKKVKRFSPHLFREGYFGRHPMEEAEEISEESQTTDEIKESHKEDLLEKHDFEFKVSVDEQDFTEEEKNSERK